MGKTYNYNLFTAMNQTGGQFPATIGQAVINTTGANVYLSSFDATHQRKWGTYFGGSGTTASTKIAATANNDIYLIGYQSGGIPSIYNQNNGSFYQSDGAGYIASFNQSGQFTWGSFIAGYNDISTQDFTKPVGLSIYENGNDRKFYVVGSTTANTYTNGCNSPSGNAFPLCSGTGTRFSQDKSQVSQMDENKMDGFIMEFNLNDNGLEWSTVYGGRDNDYLYDVLRVDDNGKSRIYAVGATLNDYQLGPEIEHGTVSSPQSPNVLLLTDPGSGAYFQYNTAQGYGSFVHHASDGLILEFDENYQLAWSTVYGGDRDEVITSLTYNKGRLVVAGSTESDTYTSVPTLTLGAANNSGLFPLCNANGTSYVQTYGGATDAFIASFEDRNLDWSTYYGGNVNSSTDASQDGFARPWQLPRKPALVQNDKYNNLIVTGTSTKNNATANNAVTIPVTSPTTNALYYQPKNASANESNSGEDAFFLLFRPSNNLKWATHYGGNSQPGLLGTAGPDEEAKGMVVDDNNQYIYSTHTSVSGKTPVYCNSANQYCQLDYTPALTNNPPSTDAVITCMSYGVIADPLAIHSLNKPTEFYSIVVFPNPATAEVHLSFIAQQSQSLQLDVADVTGKKIQHKELKATPGNNTTIIDLHALSCGTYFLTLGNSGVYETAKVVKE